MTTRFKRALDTFKLPPDIESDIVYCQRTLKNYLKIHQMIVEHFNIETDCPEMKALHLRQIERELSEINCEQEYLLLRLKRIIDEYIKAQNRDDVPTSRTIIHEHVSRIIVSLVNNENYLCIPTLVQTRATEDELRDIYLRKMSKDSSLTMDMNVLPIPASISSADQTSIVNSNERRVSLLKPISERVVNAIPIVIPDDDIDVLSTSPEQPPTWSEVSSNSHRRLPTVGLQTSPFLTSTTCRRMSSHLPTILRRSPPKATQPTNVYVQLPSICTTTTSIVESSAANNKRQNLRNALINAAANMKNQSTTTIAAQPPIVSHIAPYVYQVPQHSAHLMPRDLKTTPTPTIAEAVGTRKPVFIASKNIKVDPAKNMYIKLSRSDPSSSEDSVELPQLNVKTKPQDYTQHDFLSLFNLYTNNQIQMMQQRRSKRQRRCAHHNERDDFHYGGLDYMTSPDIGKKRRREFLSPRGNRRVKKANTNKRLSDRSGSSSPDEQSCKECCKRSYGLSQCKECQGVYHENCHKDSKHEPNQCPSCARAQNQKVLKHDAYITYNTIDLRGQYRELREQMAIEERRREKLRRENINYKLNMSKLYGIVNEIKRDDE